MLKRKLIVMAIILIVDDNPRNTPALRLALRDTHHVMCEATNGKQALELADSINPDLVLLDIMMPIMDGFEVCKALRASPRHAQVPVIFVTALDDSAEKVRL
ncbi:MAG: response regulator [Chloroflexi bacterium]|nr:response regulator [Chloroflexota bacterium]